MICEIDFLTKTIPMRIFNYNSSEPDTEGKDLISNFLEIDNCWKPFQTEIMYEILKDKGTFIDVGCHIGYYSILGNILGCKVISIDSNMNYLNLFMKTIRDNELENIEIKNLIISKGMKRNDLILTREKIKLLKISISGNEVDLINCFNEDLSICKIENIIMEITPVRCNYIGTILKLKNYGYKIYDIGNSPQRSLQKNTNHLSNLKELNIYDLENYLNTLKDGQTNFLFKI